MAFPTIETADSKSGTVTSNSTSWTLTYPTNLVSGDLMLAIIGSDGDNGITSAPGFGWYQQGSTPNCECFVFAGVSDGTETGTFSAVFTGSEQGSWRTLRVTGWYGGTITTGPIGGAGGPNFDGISWVQSIESSSSTPNPVSRDPANWGAEDTLWIVAAGVDRSRTFSAWPSGYSPGDNSWDNVSGGANGASLSVAWKNANASSEDPGTWTISASDDWVAATVAVRPAAGVAATSLYSGISDRRTPRRRMMQRI